MEFRNPTVQCCALSSNMITRYSTSSTDRIGVTIIGTLSPQSTPHWMPDRGGTSPKSFARWSLIQKKFHPGRTKFLFEFVGWELPWRTQKEFAISWYAIIGTMPPDDASAHFLASDFSSELVKSAYNLLLPLHSSRRWCWINDEIGMTQQNKFFKKKNFKKEVNAKY